VRIGRFETNNDTARFGMFREDRVYDLGEVADIAAAIDVDEPAVLDGRSHDLADVRVLAPVTRPSKVLCVGINYVPHMEESGFERPAEPVIFSKLPSTLVGPNDAIILPKAAPRRVDYEAELVIVIGRGGHDIARDSALEHVAGFTVGNDVSARDWQLKKPGGQWLLGKSFDTFLPLGPWIVTPDEFGDPTQRHVRCRVNGELLQDDVLANLIFDFADVISYISKVATLVPGDLIMTGTPGGVGQSRTPARWLQDGDIVETEIDGIGTLRNPVRAAQA
jgi:2-keto-4-pentenoate hydratase/2-oxohepta-3-ene-1,7-dioic acid hydratase in catechol pathway